MVSYDFRATNLEGLASRASGQNEVRINNGVERHIERHTRRAHRRYEKSMLVGVDGASTKGVDTYDSLSGVSGLLMTQLERPVPSTSLPSTVLYVRSNK